MPKQFKKLYSVKLPRSRHDVEEFGKGERGLVLCKKCTSAYFKKSWHHDLQGLKDINKDAPIKFVVCPACQMIENGQYEGRITIKNVPEKFHDELDHLIRNFCHRAFERDPMDRLIELKKIPSAGSSIEAYSKSSRKAGLDWKVTLTENELASKLGSKIKEVFKKAEVKIRFNKEPSDVAEVTVEF